jgi:hypothetical protein
MTSRGQRLVIALLVLVGCWVLWFLLQRGWIIALGLSVVASLTAEYLGTKIFSGNSWFESLSVEHSGFSVWRVVLLVMAVLLIFSLIVLDRLAFSKIIY